MIVSSYKKSIMSILYSTQVTALGGRAGTVKSDDGLLDLALALPKALGGKGGATNPEQLFAAGYAACFENAVIHVTRTSEAKVKDDDIVVLATVGLQPNDAGGFALAVALDVTITGLDQAQAEALVAKAHAVCPYSNAVKGNIDVAHSGSQLRTSAMDLPNDDDPLDLDRQVCFPLYAASNLLNRLYRPMLAKLGLTYPQYLVMLVLWQNSPQTVGSIGQMLHLDSGTLTPLLKRMEQAGLVVRARDPEDERRVLIDLTAPGKALRTDARAVPEMLAAGLDLDEADVASLREQVRALVAALKSATSLQS